MKKAILILVLLVLAGCAVLYFGWVNIKPGYFGIAHSTLTGTVGYPLETGRVHWLWQKLIPKSFHLYTVDKQPRSLEFDASYPLPGKEQLQEFGTFDLVLHTSVQYSIGFDAARGLIDLGILSGFEDHLKNEISDRVGDGVSDFILENMIRHSQYDAGISYGSLDTLKKKIEVLLRDTVLKYGLSETSWSVTFREIPQIDLYNDALDRYFAHLEMAYQYKKEQLDREAVYLTRQKENELEIDRWEKYGELISRYPELLKYFYIEKFSGQADVLVLPQNEATGFPKMLEPWELYPKEPPPGTVTPPSAAKPGTLEGSAEEGGRIEEPAGHEAERKIDTPVADEGEGKEGVKKWYESLMFWKRADDTQ